MPKRIWTPDRVIEELKRTRRNGPRANRKLDDAARRCFGSVRAALEVAGLPCGQPERRTKGWSRAAVVESIRQRHRNGESLVRTNREYRALYEAAKLWHGSWTAALEAAGFPRPPRDYYTADEVQLRIIDSYERELPLTLKSYNDLKLERSVRRHFGRWRLAVESLGLSGELRRIWTDRTVIDAIVRRRASGLSIYMTLKEDIGLYTAAANRFGSWHSALQAAGIEGWVREQWSEEKVLERLRQLMNENIPAEKIRTLDTKVTAAARKRYGSLRRAMVTAGFQISPRRRTAECVIAAIRTRYSEKENSEKEKIGLRGFGDKRLATAATQFFGSWAEAVEAAGLTDRITVKKPPRRWTRREVIQGIVQWHTTWGSLEAIENEKTGLIGAARYHFGTWCRALEAAGFRCKNRRWTNENIIEDIKQRLEAGASLSSDDHSNINLASAAHRFFGSWPAALQAAGVTSKPRKPRKAR